MCGIIISNSKKTILDKLNQQVFRGLDSIGLIIPSDNSIHYIIEEDIDGYEKVLDEHIIDGVTNIIHHRKASVGAISIANTHPFKTEKYVLIQNGTMKNFFKDYKTIYPLTKVDSEMLSEYLNDFSTNILDLEDLLNKIDDDKGIVVVIDNNYNTLIYSDGKRESVLNINGDKFQSFYNYSKKGYGYANKGALIYNKDGIIIYNSFEKINKVKFKEEAKTPIVTNKDDYYDDYYDKINNYNTPEFDFTEDIKTEATTFFKQYKGVMDYKTTLGVFLNKFYNVKTPTEWEIDYGDDFPYIAFREVFNLYNNII